MKKQKQNNNWYLTLGSDPELFVLDTLSNKVISSIGILGERDKDNPIPLDKHCKFYSDNVALEFSIKPAISKQGFVSALRKGFAGILEFLHQNHGDRYDLLAQSYHDFDPDELEHPNARIVGCSPNFDAYRMCQNEPPDLCGGTGRSTGFHLHYGRSNFKSIKNNKGETLLDDYSKNDIILLSDIFVGNSLNIIDNDET